MTAPSALGLSLSADLNVAKFVTAAKQAHRSLIDITEYAKKNGTLELTLKLSGTSLAAAKAQIDAAVGGRTLPFKITFDAASVTTSVSALRAALTGIASINLSTVTAVQAQIAAQITTLNGLIAQLRALGGGSGGGRGGGGGGGNSGISAQASGLLDQLERLNNEYKRGDVSADFYARRLNQLQGQLQMAARSATAGSNEFRLLDRAITQTVNGLRNVEAGKITSLKTELAGARAAFDAAAGAATNLAQRRAAIAAYEGDLQRIRVALTGMATSGRLTEQQLGAVNRMLAQTAQESNRINGRGGANFGGGLSNALQQLSGYLPGFSQLSGILGNMPPQVMGLVAAFALLTAGMAASFKTAAEFQQKMADITALTGAAGPELQKLNDLSKDFGVPLGVGATKAADAVLSLSRAGLSAAEIAGGGLASALNLAAAAGIETAKAGDLAVTAWTAFGQKDNLSHVADVYANFANQTVLEAENLGLALAAVGPVAKSAGMDLQQFSGYMALLAKGGFKNMSDAGTSLKSMLLSLQSPSTTAATAMANIGLNVYDASGKMRPFLEIVGDMRERLKGLSEQQRNNALKSMFGTDGIRAAQIMYGLTNKEIKEMIGNLGKQGSAAEVAKSRMNTYQGSVAQMKANFEALRVEIGEKLLPAATGLVQFANGLVSGFRSIANSSEQLMGYLIPLGGAVLTFTGPAVISGLASISAALAGMAASSMAWVAANPFGIVAIAVAALAMKVNQLYGEIAQIYEQVDKADQESHDKMMARVNALIKQNTELSRAQARYLLATERLAAAQQGTATGVNLWGERQYAIDPAEVKRAQEALAGARKELTALQLQANRKGDPKKSTDDATGLSPERLQTQSAALTSLKESLTSRMDALDADLPPKLSSKINLIERAYKKLGDDLKKAFGGNLNNAEYLKGVAEMEAAKQKEISAARRKWASDEAKKRQEEEQKAGAAVVSATQEGEKARIDAMVDGAAKRAAQRRLEIQQAEAETSKSLIGVKSDKAHADLVEAGRLKVAAINAKWNAADRKAEEETAKQVAEISRQTLVSRQEIEIGLMQEGRAKRQAQLDLDIAQARAETAKAIDDAKGKPEVIAALEASGAEKVRGIREKARQTEEAASREHARKLLQYAADSLQAQENLAAARRATASAIFERDAARQMEALRGNALTQAQLEEELNRKRANMADAAARTTEESQRRQLVNTRDQALSADNLTAEDRQHIWQKYYSDVGLLDAKSHTDAVQRLADREAKERETTEKIRAARVAAAEKSLETGQTNIGELEFQKGLAKTAAERLNYELQLQQAHAGQEAIIRGILARATELKLTDEEKKKLNSDLTNELHAQQTIVAGMPALQKEVTQEIAAQAQQLREIESKYGQINELMGGTTGFARAQDELTASTNALSDAYAGAVPWMEKVRDGTLKPSEYNDLSESLGKFVSALEDQRAKLVALRGEYEKQRDALASVQEVLKGFGTELGDQSLIENAISVNQSTYDHAKTALDTLLKGGKFDAAQLAEATQKVQAGYNGLKDSVVALGEARAKVFEKEKDGIEKASKAQTDLLDKQIKSAKDAGLDTTALEQQRDAILAATQRRVDALEAQAAKARQDAQDAVADRTKGLQALLKGVAEGAGKAQQGVADLASKVKTAEQQVKDSTTKMRTSMESVFKGIPDLAGKAGASAGQQFMAALQKGLKPITIPGVKVPSGASATSAAASAASVVNNITVSINGNNMTGSTSQTMKQLLKALANEADRECRQRNS